MREDAKPGTLHIAPRAFRSVSHVVRVTCEGHSPRKGTIVAATTTRLKLCGCCSGDGCMHVRCRPLYMEMCGSTAAPFYAQLGGSCIRGDTPAKVSFAVTPMLGCQKKNRRVDHPWITPGSLLEHPNTPAKVSFAVTPMLGCPKKSRRVDHPWIIPGSPHDHPHVLAP